METTIAGINVNVNDQGYLTDFSQWTKEIGMEIARQYEITLTDRHMEIIQYLQQEHKNDRPLTIRKIGKSGVVDIKEFYSLFPGGPLKISSKIAGIPKPVSCI